MTDTVGRLGSIEAQAPLDLVLKNGRLFDPASGLDRIGAIGFQNGRIAVLDPPPKTPATAVVDVASYLVTPGLIDLHTHVYYGGTSLGVKPEDAAAASAVATLVDAGSAGPGNFLGFREHIIEPAAVRILAYLNISFAGIFGFGRAFSVGEGFDPELLQSDECLTVAHEHPDIIVGIKARVGPSSSGATGIEPLRRALAVAETAGLPVMAHVEAGPPDINDILRLLRPGDILTHCSRPLPNAIAPLDGAILMTGLAARERGVVFDVGHGRGSFSFESFRRMMSAGFLPDIVSSDVHAFNHQQRGVDLMTTMTKLMALGVPLETVVVMATANPAGALRRPDLGSLRPGSRGDASVIEVSERPVDLVDTVGVHLRAERQFSARGTVRNGKWHPNCSVQPEVSTHGI